MKLVSLCESSPQQIERLYSYRLKLQWQSMYSDNLSTKEVVDKLCNCIPPKLITKYIGPLTKWFLDADENLNIKDDSSFISQAFQLHFNNRKGLTSDPTKYASFSELLDELHQRGQAKGKDLFGQSADLADSTDTKGLETVIAGKLYKITSAKAAATYGAPTWCISHPDTDDHKKSALFYEYSNDLTEPFFIITLPKTNPKYSKIGVFPGKHGRGEFQDRMNNRLSLKDIHKLWDNNPDVYKAILPHIYAHWWKLPDDCVVEILQPTMMVQYCVARHTRIPKIETRLLKQSTFSNPASQAPFLVQYASDVIGGRWPKAEQHILDSADRYLSHGSELAIIKYCIGCVKGRWPEAEQRILDWGCGDLAVEYALQIMKKRWPEAEQYIDDNAHGIRVKKYNNTFGIKHETV